MRRFSQRNALVTLSDINITPLLDLAFVLLIIFVITTPLLEQGMDLSLSKGGRADKALEKSDIKTIEVSTTGVYTLATRRMELPLIERELKAAFTKNPNLVVFIRADQNSPAKYFYAVIDLCQRVGITRFSLRTEPTR